MFLKKIWIVIEEYLQALLNKENTPIPSPMKIATTSNIKAIFLCEKKAQNWPCNDKKKLDLRIFSWWTSCGEVLLPTRLSHLVLKGKLNLFTICQNLTLNCYNF